MRGPDVASLGLSEDDEWLLACAGAAVCRIESPDAERSADRLARLGLVARQPLSRQAREGGLLSVIEITPAGRAHLARH